MAAVLRLKLSADDRADMLIKMARDSEDEQVRLKALLAIIERTDGKVKDEIEISTPLSDEEYREELAIIAREVISAASPEEREKLLSFDPAPTDTIQ